MPREASAKYANRRVRSFNLDDTHYLELKSLSKVEDCSMSDILNRVLWHGLAKMKVAEDIANGLQTVLKVHTQSIEARENNRKNKKILTNKCNPQAEPYCMICWGEEE